MKRLPSLWYPAGCFLLFSACGSTEPEPMSPVAKSVWESPIDRPRLPQPEDFDIRVHGSVEGRQVLLDIDVDIPEGSYVISALSDRDYLGKFQILWTDSLITPANHLVEDPVSVPRWEPWDQVYTAMLCHPTTIRQTWDVPHSIDTACGEVFFVLEPQCVPYAVDFSVVMVSGAITNSLVHPRHPD